MRFFIFVSKPMTRRHSSLFWGLGIFVLSFLIFIVLDLWIVRCRPDWVYQESIPDGVSDLQQSILQDAFGEPYDEYIFYHNIGHAMTWARQADVLIFGNSRPLFAFRSPVIEQAEQQSGLKIYNLAGPGSTVTYVLSLIRKQNLHPRFVVLNEDNFFNPVVWPTQKAAMAQSDWQSWMNVSEHNAAWIIRSALRNWIPRFTFFKEHRGKEFYLLRSVQNGGLFFEDVSSQSIPQTETPQGSSLSVDPLYLERARLFKKEVEDRGGQLVLTHVPSSVHNQAFAKSLAKELKVPYVEPRLLGLKTFDQSHLTPNSADRFSKAFFAQFFKLDEVKKIIR